MDTVETPSPSEDGDFFDRDGNFPDEQGPRAGGFTGSSVQRTSTVIQGAPQQTPTLMSQRERQTRTTSDEMDTGEDHRNSARALPTPETEGSDTMHSINGQLQPSVSERLTQLHNFLSDGDEGWCVNWKPYMVEAREFVDRLRHEHVLKGLDQETSATLDKVLRRMQAHDLSAGQRTSQVAGHRTMPRPNRVPRLEPRFRIDVGRAPDGNTALGLGLAAGEYQKPPGARKVIYRAPAIVNVAMNCYPGWLQHVRDLAAAEDATWAATPGQPADEATKLARSESAEYGATLGRGKKASVTGNAAWLGKDQVRPDTAENYAAERGMRRGLLQSCLRQLDSSENKSKAVQTPWRRVVPPVEARLLERHRRAASAVQFSARPMPREEAERMSPDAMPYTRRMNKYWHEFDQWWEEARQQARQTPAGSLVTLPPRRAPWIARSVPVAVEHYQDLLRLCRTVASLLERASRVAPRPLIRECCEMMSAAAGSSAAGQQEPRAQAELRPVDWDWEASENGKLRLRMLNETELNFLRLLCTGSINQHMLRRLRDRSSLYLAFAERLQRVLDDLSSDNVFATANTEVPVERLLEVMHRGTDGENKRTQFSVHDACCWLERLHREGRVRFRHDITCYGVARRPLTDIHPEHQVRWVPAPDDQPRAPPASRDPPSNMPAWYEFDSVMAPRPSDLCDWSEVVSSGSHRKPLPAGVRRFFGALAYRLGYTIFELEKTQAPKWADVDTQSPADMEKALAACEGILTGWRGMLGLPEPLAEVCASLEPALFGPGRTRLTEARALQHIRTRIVEEAERSADSLYPTRWQSSTAADGSSETWLLHEPIWDWARPHVCGVAKRFFALDRYPLQYQTPARKRAIHADTDLDPSMLWDPCTEDLTESRWLVRKARPFGQDKVVYLRGPASYLVGDTPLQQQAIETYMHNVFVDALNAASQAEPQKHTFLSRLSGIVSSLSFSRPSSQSGRGEAAQLPLVNKSQVPGSFDQRKASKEK